MCGSDYIMKLDMQLLSDRYNFPYPPENHVGAGSDEKIMKLDRCERQEYKQTKKNELSNKDEHKTTIQK